MEPLRLLGGYSKLILEEAEGATRGKEVYLRAKTPELAQQFADGLVVSNVSVHGRIITFTFDTEIEAIDFHRKMCERFRK